MNKAAWYHTIAKNNGRLAGWDTWWAAYHTNVITPDRQAKRQAAIAEYDKAHPRTAQSSSPVRDAFIPEYLSDQRQGKGVARIQDSLDRCTYSMNWCTREPSGEGYEWDRFSGMFFEMLVDLGIAQVDFDFFGVPNLLVARVGSGYSFMEVATFGDTTDDFVISVKVWQQTPKENLTNLVGVIGTAAAGVSLLGFGSCVVGFAPGCGVGVAAAKISTYATLADLSLNCSTSWSASCTMNVVDLSSGYMLGKMSKAMDVWAPAVAGARKGVDLSSAGFNYSFSAVSYYQLSDSVLNDRGRVYNFRYRR